jgi:hypothetical protein
VLPLLRRWTAPPQLEKKAFPFAYAQVTTPDTGLTSTTLDSLIPLSKSNIFPFSKQARVVLSVKIRRAP